MLLAARQSVNVGGFFMRFGAPGDAWKSPQISLIAQIQVVHQ